MMLSAFERHTNKQNKAHCGYGMVCVRLKNVCQRSSSKTELVRFRRVRMCVWSFHTWAPLNSAIAAPVDRATWQSAFSSPWLMACWWKWDHLHRHEFFCSVGSDGRTVSTGTRRVRTMKVCAAVSMHINANHTSGRTFVLNAMSCSCSLWFLCALGEVRANSKGHTVHMFNKVHANVELSYASVHMSFVAGVAHLYWSNICLHWRHKICMCFYSAKTSEILSKQRSKVQINRQYI